MLYEARIAGLDDFEIKLLGKKVRRADTIYHILSSVKIFSKKEKPRGDCTTYVKY